VKSGEFAELSEEEIREIYVQEEADAVERDEMADVHRQMDEDEERASNPDIDPDE
jgi:chromosome condensin MukBEF ATPase and DNA-binding subunit MukB